jgi:hypothetical protein
MENKNWLGDLVIGKIYQTGDVKWIAEAPKRRATKEEMRHAGDAIFGICLKKAKQMKEMPDSVLEETADAFADILISAARKRIEMKKK